MGGNEKKREVEESWEGYPNICAVAMLSETRKRLPYCSYVVTGQQNTAHSRTTTDVSRPDRFADIGLRQ